MSGAADPIDPLAVLGALGVAGAHVVTPVLGGMDTAIWRVELPTGPAPGGPAPGQLCALRVFRPDQVRACEREVAAMTAAAGAGLPVPGLLASGTWRQRPALLLTWCPGHTLDEELGQHPWRAWPLGVAFGRLQARIHAIGAGAVPPALQEAPLRWVTWAGPVDDRLAARLGAAAGPEALLHLDYHPRNVLTDGRRLTAVLDWTNARLGDPRADVARTFTILRLAPRPAVPATPRAALTALVIRGLAAAWRLGYRQGAGALPDMAPFYAWAGGVIVADMGKRAGQPGSWLRSEQLDPARRWAAGWRRRAGV